jgi:hypothetical protein
MKHQLDFARAQKERGHPARKEPGRLFHLAERSAGILPACRCGRDGHAPLLKGARASCPQAEMATPPSNAT